MSEMDARSILAQIYSHPLGNHGHGLGASIDFRSAERENAAAEERKKLRKGAHLAMEFNIAAEIPEWEPFDGGTAFLPGRITDDEDIAAMKKIMARGTRLEARDVPQAQPQGVPGADDVGLEGELDGHRVGDRAERGAERGRLHGAPAGLLPRRGLPCRQK